MKVFKYTIPDTERFSVMMPEGAKFLSLLWQDPSQYNPKGGPVMWWSVPSNPKCVPFGQPLPESTGPANEEHFFCQAMTGFEVPKPEYGTHYEFRGTYQAGAGIILHLFEEVWA